VRLARMRKDNRWAYVGAKDGGDNVGEADTLILSDGQTLFRWQ
jgi:hypothetical protein